MASSDQNANLGPGVPGQRTILESEVDSFLAFMNEKEGMELPIQPSDTENDTMPWLDLPDSAPYSSQQNVDPFQSNGPNMVYQDQNPFMGHVYQPQFTYMGDVNPFQNGLSDPFGFSGQDIPWDMNNNLLIPQENAVGSALHGIPQNITDSGIISGATLVPSQPIITPVVPSQPITTPAGTSPVIPAIPAIPAINTAVVAATASPSPISAPVQSTGRGMGTRKRKTAPEPEPESGGEGQDHRQKRQCKQFACNRCRKAKVKCDVEVGKCCSKCTKTGKTCVTDYKDARTKNTNFEDFLTKLEKKAYLIKECIYLGNRVTTDEQLFKQFKAYWNPSRSASTALEMFTTLSANGVEWENHMRSLTAENMFAISEIMQEAKSISFQNVKVKDVRPLKDKLKKVAHWTLAWLYSKLDKLASMTPEPQDITYDLWFNEFTQIDCTIGHMNLEKVNDAANKNYLRSRGKLYPTYLKRVCGEWAFKQECLQHANINRSLSPAVVPQAQQPLALQPQAPLPPQGQQLVPEAQANTIHVNPGTQVPILPQNVPAAVPQAQQPLALLPQAPLQPQGQQLVPEAQANTILVNTGAQAPILPQDVPAADEMDIDDVNLVHQDHSSPSPFPGREESPSLEEFMKICTNELFEESESESEEEAQEEAHEESMKDCMNELFGESESESEEEAQEESMKDCMNELFGESESESESEAQEEAQEEESEEEESEEEESEEEESEISEAE
ncbi:hypothetical protein PG999_002684 [Apiospora kogelbergensis]|uniref:Zn(2)-C6 fungal-type domain-containing protein n=1 Tax=Apiospora kogelbergensis TaxID=1337665 RepID=A0AAW0R8W2_9PEZI